MDDDSSMFDFQGADDSENFEPVAVKKKVTKAAPKAKEGAKKAGRPAGKAATAKTTATKQNKRALSDDEDEASDFEDLSNTPPAAKKTKTTKKATKKDAKSTPLKDLDNLNSDEYDEGESMLLKTAREVAKASGKTASDTYQMISPTDHVLKRPDTYVGSIERTERSLWIHDAATDQMLYREVSFVPGLFKIFDEIIVNAADNKVRDPSMDTLKVTLDREKNVISVFNNGQGIPIEIHEKVKIYIPEMIFGHLLTSSNYDDDQKKVTGGRNGYGAKLCNIFATEFIVETAEKGSKKRYKQVWKNNMGTCNPPQIKTLPKGEEFTKITFKPDLQRFGMTELDEDFEALVRRRVYDIAGAVKGLKVFYNGERVKVKSFKEFMNMHIAAIQRSIKPEDEVNVKSSDIIYEQVNDRWEIGFSVSDGTFQQVSFVNSIATTQGGTHVQYISDEICKKLIEALKKKKVKGVTSLKPNQIKNHFFLFVNCLIENPAFTSQTKEQLTTRPSAFGSKCPISDAFMKKIVSSDIMNSMSELAQVKADQALKKTDGSRRARVNNPKLVDANKAGTKEGYQCTLILTEGDSAKSMAISGMEVVGRDLFGVFPLKGKLLNVRDASHDQIANNAEIQNIKQILGLQHKKNYETAKDLRYGHLMIMTDQDHDGSHIKGLLINFLEAQFPSLLKIPGFLIEFITPIVKVYKGTILKPTKVKSFFTMPEYQYWKEHNTEKGWQHKYYKGLGTSSNVEAREYFADLDKHLKEFHAMQQEDRALIDMVFSKKKTEERKEWLRLFKPGTYLDHSIDKISYDDFVNKELILFSMADNIRSIPSIVDGLKPGQRKVLFACFKCNLKKDMKVSQLAGYVSVHTSYQHGEQNLAMTITALAQNFVGSNNVNLLEPVGNFGSRLAGGKDASSPRYIATMLSPLARALFPQSDDALLDYNLDDGVRIEPMWYCPILPLVLLNGSDGIGTGWSSFIPNYNPDDVLRNIRHLMNDEELEPMTPWYRGFTGSVDRIGPDKYQFSGKITQVNETKVEITELPVRLWTQEFKEKLDTIIKGPEKNDKDKKDKKEKKDKDEKPWIKDYLDYNSDLRVHFIVEMENKSCMDAALKEGLEARFKLTKTMSLTNMVAFDPQGRIMKYESVDDIMKEFYFVRLKLYQDRKEWMLGELNKQLRKLTNQARFVQMIIKKELVVSNKKRVALIAELQKLKFDVISNKKEAEQAGETEPTAEGEDEDQQEETDVGDGYNYLLGMAIWSLTKEKVDKLLGECRAKEEEIDQLVKKSPKELWNADLDAFEQEWHNQLEDEKRRNSSKSAVKKSRKVKVGGGKAAKKLLSDEDDDFVVSKAKKKAAPKAAAPKAAAKGLKQTTLFSKLNKGDKPLAEDLGDNEPIVARNAGPRRAATAASKKVVDLSDSDDDFDDYLDKLKPSAAETKKSAARIVELDDDDDDEVAPVAAKSKKSSAPSIKSEAEDSHAEDNDDDDAFDIANLVKGKDTAGKSSAFNKEAIASQPKKTEPATKKPTAVSKVKEEAIDLSDDEDESVVAPVRRAAPEKKAAAPKPAAKPYDDSFDMDIDDSDDEPIKPAAKKAAAAKAKPAAKPAPAPKAKPAKPAKKKVIESEDEDEEEEDEEEESEKEAKRAPKPAKPATKNDPLDLDSLLTDSPSRTPKKKELMAKKPVAKPAAKPAAPPAARGRPGRAAAKPVKYIDSDDDEDDDESEAVSLEGDDSEDDFDDSD